MEITLIAKEVNDKKQFIGYQIKAENQQEIEDLMYELALTKSIIDGKRFEQQKSELTQLEES